LQNNHTAPKAPFLPIIQQKFPYRTRSTVRASFAGSRTKIITFGIHGLFCKRSLRTQGAVWLKTYLSVLPGRLGRKPGGSERQAGHRNEVFSAEMCRVRKFSRLLTLPHLKAKTIFGSKLAVFEAKQ